MLYLSGIHALNLNCSLGTPGDWHQSGIRWDAVPDRLLESDDSVFGDYGIEANRELDCYEAKYDSIHIANHIRACLDLIAAASFGSVQGMREYFIGDDQYDFVIFDKVLLLKNSFRWTDVDRFMGKEYGMKWVRYREERQ